MYDRILVPLDGSALSESALDVAGIIPGRLVYLLRVEQHAPEVNHYIGPDGRETHRRIVYREGDEYLRRAGETFRSQGRQVESLRSWGDPADRIAEAAADVDLIVMATHGRGPAGRLIHGSVADRVAREVPVPVLLVPGGYRPHGTMITRILLPLDGSELAETALPAAVALGGELGVPVHAVCVVDPRTGQSPGKGSQRPGESVQRTSTFAAHAARIYLEDCLQRHGDGVTTSYEVTSGATIAALERAIRPGDLVVMTTHGHRGLRRLVLGSVAEALVRGGLAPILLHRAGTGSFSSGSTAQRAEGRA